MRRVDTAIAWLIILLGVRFALVAPREFHDGSWPWATGFWLVNCAVVFVTCGTMHLVRIRHHRTVPALRALCAAMSVAVALLQFVAGVVGGETAPASVVATLLLMSAALSMRREHGLVAG